jgi:hypothetical protein
MLFVKRSTRPSGDANPFISYRQDMANAAAEAGMEYGDFVRRIVDAGPVV